MCWLGPAPARAAKIGPGLGPALAWPGPGRGRPGPNEGPARARSNTWILTFSSKINFGRMNMRKRLLWPEICQFNLRKPYRTCRTLIFNFQRKSEFFLFFSLAGPLKESFHDNFFVQKIFPVTPLDKILCEIVYKVIFEKISMNSWFLTNFFNWNSTCVGLVNKKHLCQHTQ